MSILKLLITIDMIAYCAPVGAVFIRLANLMNSEIIGTPASIPWAFVFEKVDQILSLPYILVGVGFIIYSIRK